MIDHEIKKQIIENIEIDINDFLNIHFENLKLSKIIDQINDQDIKNMKYEIIKLLNDQDEFIYILKTIYENSLQIVYYNDLDLKDQNDQDQFNEIFQENYFLCFDLLENKKVEYIGIYGNEDQGSIDKIHISIPSIIDFL